MFTKNKKLFGNVDEDTRVKFFVEAEGRLMSGHEMLSYVRNAQTASGVHDKSLCPDEYSVFLGCLRVSWLMEYWGRVAYPTLNPPLSRNSAGFSRDIKDRSALFLRPVILFGMDGIQYSKCGCKAQQQTETPTNCRNCRCVKRQQPCSIFCCCKGKCSNPVNPNFMTEQSLFIGAEIASLGQNAMAEEVKGDDDLGQSDDEEGEEYKGNEEDIKGREEDDNSLAQSSGSDDGGSDFGGDQDDDEM